MSDYLIHHGIKGQKWGVRRFQNADGTRTVAGRKREMYRRRVISAAKTKDAVDAIISTMSDKERRMLMDDDDEYLTREQGSAVVKRIMVSDAAKTPVAFFDLLESDDGKSVAVAIGTRSGEGYRHKGYATAAAKKGIAWYEKNKDRLGYERLDWDARTENEKSIALAKKIGLQLSVYSPRGVSYSDKPLQSAKELRRTAKKHDLAAERMRRRQGLAPIDERDTESYKLEKMLGA